MTSSVDPDEITNFELSHLDPHCLQSELELEFYSLVNTVKVMPSWSVKLFKLLMGKFSPLRG